MTGKVRLILILLIIILPAKLLAQAPAISYTSPQIYNTNTPITPLTPVNNGGAVPINAAYGQVTTFAGSGTAGNTNATGTNATFNFPTSVALDANKNVYVADAANHLIRKITQTGDVSTLAGSGTSASIDGTGSGASFGDLYYVTFDPIGNVLYVCDGNAIRKITLAGTVTTIAGNYSNSGLINATNGLAARFYSPAGLCTDATGNLYVADKSNNVIRKITPGGSVSPYAGAGALGTLGHEHDNGPAVSASFTAPNDIAIDVNGNLFVTESGYHAIRKIAATTGFVSIYAGTGAEGNTDGPATSATFDYPEGICTDKIGNVYITQDITSAIRKISTGGQVTTIAGSAVTGSTDGIGNAAAFNRPAGMAADNGQFYVADALNNKIRLISLTGYTISKPLPPGLTFDGKTGIISGTPTAAAAADTYLITAYNIAGSSSATLNLQVLAGGALPTPVITFPTPAPFADANGNLTPTATSTSNESPIYYTSSDPSIATITANGLIHLVGVGVVTITAHQDASPNFSAAVPVDVQLHSIRGQVITFPPISTKTVCSADFQVNATTNSNSGIPITYSSNNTSVATVSSQGIVHIVGPGSTNIIANQNGNFDYVAAIPQSQVLTVSPPVNPRITVSTDPYIPCYGVTMTFTANASGVGSNPIYQWTINGIPVLNNNTTTLSGNTFQSGDQISCTVTNTTDCSTVPTATSGNVSFGLRPNITPTISIASSVTGPVCSGSSFTFTATSNVDAANASYQWMVNGSNIGTNSPTFTTATLNDGDVVTCQLIASAAACTIPPTALSNGITASITPNEVPSITINASATDIYAYTPVTFTATVTNTTATLFYQWQVNGVNAGINSPVFTTDQLKNNDKITCTITSVTSCVAPATSLPLTIVVMPPPTVKVNNTFTPNGDGINDVWNIPDLSFYPNCTVSIFDRLGALIYQSNGYSKPWDGTRNGRQVSVGTYYYVIKPNDNGSALSGSVTIIR